MSPPGDSVVVFGGTGTFGRLLVEEIGACTVVGRSTGHDIRDSGACRRALKGARVAINCAGPFQGFDDTLLRACLAAGCHYVDIADDRAYCAAVRGLDAEFAARGLTAAYGCSSLPGVSGALAARVKPARARITLFIGNKNPKGAGAVKSLVGGLGQPIAAPQGELRGFRDGVVVGLPAPFGPRRVYNFDSPDYDLPGADEITVKVGFESRTATALLATIARCHLPGADMLASVGRLFSWYGSSGGVVMVEDLKSGRHAAVLARERGQRLAILPAVYVVRALCGAGAQAGARTASEVLGADELLAALERDGYTLVEGSRDGGQAEL